jgi:DNA polymerase (family 10)
MPVQNAEIAAMFDRTAELLEIQGENPFRVRAYRRAARVIEGLPHNVVGLLSSGQELPGIGSDLAGKIDDIVKTGHFTLLDSLRKLLPGDLADMAALPGLGPKRVKLLYDKLHVRTLDDLRRVVRSGHIRELHGFGPVIERKLAVALARPAAEKRFPLVVAEAEADALVAHLGNGGRVVVAGSFRRRRDTVGDLDVLVTAADGAAVGDRLMRCENVAEVIVHGPTRTAVVLRSGLRVDIRAVPEQSWGAALLYFTGSKPHNIALRGLADQHGWKLNEYGLFAGQRRIAGATEQEVYRELGLAFIPPELREDRGVIALARKDWLPDLVTAADIRGDLHVHSDWSEGTAPIAEMAAAAKACGYAYIAITDHSRRAGVAPGLDPARLSRQIDQIERINDRLDGIEVLKGIEVDILPDGRLDLPDRVLSRLDVVIASVHSAFELTREAQTVRMIRAMDNRHVSIIGHPTGWLIGRHEPYAVDMDRLLSAAHERGCHLELVAQPDRLDVNDVHAQAAKSVGVKVAISTDAQSLAGLDGMRFGIDQARRGWLEAEDVINTRPLAELRRLLRR